MPKLKSPKFKGVRSIILIQLQHYFEKYGYAESDNYRSDETVKVSAITRFQYFANISVTGM